MRKDITQLKKNQNGKIIEILGGPEVEKKLDALGIRLGVEIIKLSSCSLKGPVVIQVNNSQVALGYSMAKKIIVDVL